MRGASPSGKEKVTIMIYKFYVEGELYELESVDGVYIPNGLYWSKNRKKWYDGLPCDNPTFQVVDAEFDCTE